MSGILRDGLSMLAGSYLPVVELFAAALGCGLFTLRRMARKDSSGEHWLIAPGLGVAVLSALSFLLVVVGHFQPLFLLPGALLILALAVASLGWELWLAREAIAKNKSWIIGGTAAVLLLLILRLAFLKGLLLPPYSDSPVHYQIVVSFLRPGQADASGLSLNTIFRDYYHYGFHSLAAWLSLVSGLAPENAISLLGQLLLVICPLSVYALTYAATRSHAAAGFSALLAALAWYMPAFGVNWGKFPALSSLAVFPSIIAAFVLAIRCGMKRPALILWGAFFLAGAALLHTRVLFCLVFAAAAAFLAFKVGLEGNMPLWRAVGLALLYVLSLLPFYGILHDYYAGLPVLVVFLVLLPIAFQEYPKLAGAVLFYALFLWLGITIPFPALQGGTTLLDSPYVEMALYIPLAVVMGAGFGGLMHRLPAAGWQRPLVAALLAGGVLLNFSPNSLRPDNCCIYYTHDDQRAFEWIRENAAPRSIFLISSYQSGNATAGTDAGLWISFLTGRGTSQVPYNVDWNDPAALEQACRLGPAALYLYAGGKQFSFPTDQPAYAVLFEGAFRSGDVSIYRLRGCP